MACIRWSLNTSKTLGASTEQPDELALLRRAIAEPVAQFILLEFEELEFFNEVFGQLLSIDPARLLVAQDLEIGEHQPVDLLQRVRAVLHREAPRRAPGS